jgi:hypothetical protein
MKPMKSMQPMKSQPWYDRLTGHRACTGGYCGSWWPGPLSRGNMRNVLRSWRLRPIRYTSTWGIGRRFG